DDTTTKTTRTTILIVLNTPIVPGKSPNFERLWHSSQVRICADGGANRLFHYDPAILPDLIKGDLDSLEDVIRQYYESKGVKVEQDPCQNTNDLDKALQVCQQQSSSSSSSDTTTLPQPPPRILIYGAFGGRFDQEMASFAALYKWSPLFDYQMLLYSEETCAFLIPSETNCEIRLPCYDEHVPVPAAVPTTSNTESKDGDNKPSAIAVLEGPTCGLIPLGCRCDSAVTSGLKWDLDGTMPLEFGGLVSSSNRVMKEVLTVKASHPLVFTAELQQHAWSSSTVVT
ncbi:MAG: hypothetical protein SGARI_001859, partial [Bacillariaceae sp.]